MQFFNNYGSINYLCILVKKFEFVFITLVMKTICENMSSAFSVLDPFP